MKKITVKIDGMMCGMCEAHICDTIRRAFPDAKKVSASRKSGEATFLAENGIDGEALKKAIEDTGYTFVSVSTEDYKKRGLFAK
ncbi:MAG: heavy-metal-associated domain-containing protein [Clostridia bacterium]|nr:heavy-metal-associated domain-containing protein [Clostridia bacterium]